MKKSVIYLLAFLILYLFLLNKAGKTYNPYVPGDYHSSLYADPAGYHVYLPGIFKGWFMGKMPSGADSVCGYGFTVNGQGKIISKYPYGVSFLQMPFYLGGMAYAKITGTTFNGYGEFNLLLVDIAGIFYSVLGLFFLYVYLKRYCSCIISVVTLLGLLFGTNVYFYTVTSAGYSHVYSFFLFSFFLYLCDRFFLNPSKTKIVLLGAVISLILLVRPFNILLIPLVLFVGSGSWKEVLSKIKYFCSPGVLFLLLAVGLLFFLPQLIYWKWAYGTFLPDTYGEEGFSNLASPMVKAFLFAPRNGLILYSPLYGILFIFLLIYAAIDKFRGIATLVIVLLMIYLSSSWYTYAMGCGFGARNFVEYSTLLVLPVAFIIQKYIRHIALRIMLALISLVPIHINQKLSGTLDMCFFGKDDWDWKEYNYLLYQQINIVEVNGEEKKDFITEKNLVDDPDSPGNKCFRAINNEFVGTVRIPFRDMGKVPPMMCAVKVDVKNISSAVDFDFAIQILREGKQVFYTFTTVQNMEKNRYPIYQQAYFPKDLDLNDELVVFIWNKHQNDFTVDNIEIKMR
jgi:hypothetical protein